MYDLPVRIFNLYCRSDDGCLGTFKSLDAILEAYPEIVDYWMNYRIEELWNGEVVRLWRADVVEKIEWKSL